MAEPQPEGVQEVASDPHAPTGSAEDRKAAAALSSLDTHEDDAAGKKNVDGKALDNAMKNLDVKDKPAEEQKKKVVKIEAADVTLLVNELELTKPKATELLRSHEGNALKAIKAFIAPPTAA